MDKTVSYFLLGMVSVLLICWFGWQEVKAQGADLLPVKYVRIEGAFQYISKEEMKKVITTQVMNGLYNVNVKQIQQSVKALPWIRKVKVKLIWPDAIKIKIKEQTPVVRWRKNELLNTKGQIFKPDNIQAYDYLPLLEGPIGNEKILLADMRIMTDKLSKQGLGVVTFQVNERRAWKLILDNKIEIKLGSHKPRKKIDRLLKTLTLIGEEQIKKIAVMDLRYANGYALRWKQGEGEINWKQMVRSEDSITSVF